MKNFIDLTGRKFGRLIVNKLTYIKNGKAYWECKCVCGNKKIIAGFHLTRKNESIKSCGCLQKESLKLIHKNNIKHGHTSNKRPSKTYISYYEMIKRCNDPKNIRYKDYGGRGITICKRWLPKNNGFINFLKDMGERPKGKSLDRINNNKFKNGYSPNNCRWATIKEQVRNQRSNRMETFNGKTQCRSAFAEEYNIPYQTLRGRLDRGMSIEEALTTPIRSRTPK